MKYELLFWRDRITTGVGHLDLFVREKLPSGVELDKGLQLPYFGIPKDVRSKITISEGCAGWGCSCRRQTPSQNCTVLRVSSFSLLSLVSGLHHDIRGSPQRRPAPSPLYPSSIFPLINIWHLDPFTVYASWRDWTDTERDWPNVLG